MGFSILQPPHSRGKRGLHATRFQNGADAERNQDGSLIERHGAKHYQAVADRARQLLMEVTTPRLRHYLEEIATESEQLSRTANLKVGRLAKG
jgi:hypothetical protein